MDIHQIHTKFLECSGLSIDSRKISKNYMFIAISGENFNANNFASIALEQGAKYAIIDEKEYFIDHRTILVENGLQCLQDLAKFHRNFLKTPIVAITGSNGKTTTKELIYSVLSKKYNTKATLGNLNNHIGVPLTLLTFTKETEIGIVEMGANHKKEIAFLCSIAQPDYGYITNFGKAHLEGFGGVQGVIEGKSEMYTYLINNNKFCFLNLNDAIQEEKKNKIKNYSFGTNKTEADTQILEVSANPFVTIKTSTTIIKSNLIGLYNANNINAAIAMGNYFGVKTNDIQQAIESYLPDNNRSQIIKTSTNEIILDAYNANPSSMAAAISNVRNLKNPNKIMILGDMFELGEDSLKEHSEIVKAQLPYETIQYYFIGKEFNKCKMPNSNFNFFESYEDFEIELEKIDMKDSIILIKGSRGMALERCVAFIK